MSKISAEHLGRQACVYIRQSSPGQVQNNLESQRLQYTLVDRARALGWQDVQVIDEDLGVSGSGTAHRVGFERLLSGLCEGKVGAVLSIEASRLARNGRDWHTLLEFCSVVGALLIDAEGIYDPRQINDRLLLGMKGTISEMEVASFRQRARAAIEQKAQRGELFMRVPIGYVRTTDDRIEKDADERVRAAIDLIFRKFVELTSARQLYLWLREQQIKLPINRGVKGERQIVWQVPSYWAVLSVLKNPTYAGAYAYGRSKYVVQLENGRKRIARIQHRRCEDWAILRTEHHEGYIDWSVYQSNQALIAQNENSKGDKVRGSIKRGVALLSGLLRCGHCGAKLHAEYPRPDVVRYTCVSHVLDSGTSCRLMFGGGRADYLVAEQVLRVVQPPGLQAAMQAIENLRDARDERVQQTELSLRQARYEVTRAQRQYDAVDASNRLVASELERRWNEALKAQSQLEDELLALQREQPNPLTAAIKAELLALADDLPRLWDHPKSLPEHKKRILRTVLKEIVAQSVGDTVKLILHWQGGDHTELLFPRTRSGQHRYVSSTETVELIRNLATIQPDSMIASILNRMKVQTAHGQSWTAMRVCSIRHHHRIERYREEDRQARGELSVSEVAALLNVTPPTVLRMIRQRRVPATQVCANAPWILLKKDVESLQTAAGRGRSPQTIDQNQLALKIQ
jgi:DNA invertase Pin-like site-specific DNA recombinase